MSFVGKRPKLNTVKFAPLSADPINPKEGEIQYSDGTARPLGFWKYENSQWVKLEGSGEGRENFIENGDFEAGIANITPYSNYYTHTVASSGGLVDEVGDAVNIPTTGLTTGAKIRYTADATPIGGLTSGNDYFINIVAPGAISLHLTRADAIAFTNLVDLTSDGTGNHTFTVTAYVDGTGASASVLSVAQNSTNPLNGENDLEITKDDSDASGEGLTLSTREIPIRFRGKPLFMEVPYDLSHINYNSGDLRLKFYDVTNDEFIYAAPIANLDDDLGFLKGKATALVLIHPVESCSEIRPSFHIDTDNATALSWDGFVDDILLGPDSPTPTSVITDVQSWTPTGSWTTNTTYSGMRWTQGDREHFQVTVSVSGAVASGALVINLPVAIDTAKLPNSGTDVRLGSVTFRDTGASDPDTKRMNGDVMYVSPTTVRPTMLLVDQSNNHYQRTINNVSLTIGSGVLITMEFSVPVVGQKSGNLMSSFEASLQSLSARYGQTSAQSIPNATTTIVNFSSKSFDEYNTVTTGAAWKFTAPYKMKVRVNAGIVYNNVFTAGIALNIFKNGALYSSGYSQTGSQTACAYVNDIVSLEQGDYIDLRAYQGSGSAQALWSSAGVNYVSIDRIPDFSVLGAYSEAGQVISSFSSTKTPDGSARWHSHTGNSITLTPGVYKLGGNVSYTNSGSTAYSQVIARWHAANGNDSGTEPTAFSTLSNISILAGAITVPRDFRHQSNNSFEILESSMPELVIQVKSPTTVFLNTFAAMGTFSNARVIVSPVATRIK